MGTLKHVLALCAWCLKEGKDDAAALIGERPPVNDTRVTHGVCDTHRKEIEDRVAQLKQAAWRVRADADRAHEAAQRAALDAERAAKEAAASGDDAADLERRVDP